MLNRDFKEFAGLLHANGVECLLVGDYALAAYGHPRTFNPTPWSNWVFRLSASTFWQASMACSSMRVGNVAAPWTLKACRCT